MKRLLLLLCLLCFPQLASAAVEMKPVVAPKPQVAVRRAIFRGEFADDSMGKMIHVFPPLVVRRLVFRAHLRGALANDPVVKVGETIHVFPDVTEPFGAPKSIVVTLPKKTPYKNAKQELYYLRGYAIGRLNTVNTRFS